MLFGHSPQARHSEINDRIDDDRIRQSKQTHGAHAENQRRDRNHRIRSIEISPYKEPRYQSPKPSSCKSPLFDAVEITSSPLRGNKAEVRLLITNRKKKIKTPSSVHLTMALPPSRCEVDNAGQKSARNNSRKLIPVKERETEQYRIGFCVQGRPHQPEEWQ